MDDRYAEFLMAVGSVCVAAERANLSVVVRTSDGARAVGVPVIRGSDSGNELDDTGYARTFRVNEVLINLDQVVSCTIHAPAGRPAH